MKQWNDETFINRIQNRERERKGRMENDYTRIYTCLCFGFHQTQLEAIQ